MAARPSWLAFGPSVSSAAEAMDQERLSAILVFELDLAERGLAEWDEMRQRRAGPTWAKLVAEAEKEEADVRQRLAKVQETRALVRQRRREVQEKRRKICEARRGWLQRLAAVRETQGALASRQQSLKLQGSEAAEQLRLFSQVNALNDAHFIWYKGNYGTINHIPLRITGRDQDRWDAVNAALGTSMALLMLVCNGLGLELSQWELHPRGNFSYLRQKRLPHTTLDLWTDGSILSSWLYPKQRLNDALVAFLQCIKEVQDHLSGLDPSLTWPFAITDQNIDGISVTLNNETKRTNVWTHAMKCVLISLKWVASAASRAGGRNGFFFLPPPPLRMRGSSVDNGS